MSDSLLPVILSSPNDPTVTLFWIELAVFEVVLPVVILVDIGELFMNIPGPVVGDGKPVCNPCRSS
jgi:hypothetical protein